MQLQCYSCEKFNDVLAHVVVNNRTNAPKICNTCKKCRTRAVKAPRKVQEKSQLNPESKKQRKFLRFLQKILTN